MNCQFENEFVTEESYVVSPTVRPALITKVPVKFCPGLIVADKILGGWANFLSSSILTSTSCSLDPWFITVNGIANVSFW